MAKFTKNSNVGGAWLDKKTLKNGDVAKLLTEAIEVEGQNGKQIVAKIKIKGNNEEFNVAINKPSKNALIEAFGEDSKDWVGKILGIQTEKGIFAGKRGIALYLIPDGFEVIEDSNGYIVITQKGQKTEPVINVDEGEVDPNDIPF